MSTRAQSYNGRKGLVAYLLELALTLWFFSGPPSLEFYHLDGRRRGENFKERKFGIRPSLKIAEDAIF